MESIETNTETNTDLPAVTSGSRKLGEYGRKGYRIVTWMNGASYFAEVDEAGAWKMTTPLESNRGRAELAAERWIDEQGKTAAPLPAHESAESAAEPESSIIGGWRIEIVDGRGGTYNAVISPAAEVAGEVDEPPSLRGYQRKKQALDEATAWAHANPLRVAGFFNGLEWMASRYLDGFNSGWLFAVRYPTAEDADSGDPAAMSGLFEGKLVYPTPDDATNEAIGWCSRFKLGEQLPTERAFGEVYPSPAETEPTGGEGVEAIEAVASAAPAAPPPAPVEKAIDEARASGGLQVVEPPPAESHTAELMELLQRKRDLKKQRRQLDAAMASAKSKVKACDDEIAEIDAQIDAVLEDERRQVPLPLTSTPAPKPSAKVSAPPPAPVKATAMPRQPIRWTANGVELEIIVREPQPERFAAKVAGLAGTEGFGETWEQAVEAAKVAASVVLADCDPGETTPRADAGPVADGPRLPPKRGGRKPKLKGKSADEVTAVLRGSMTLDEAAKTIGCSTAELEGWARDADFQLSKHLGAGDEPAPNTSKKPRAGGRGGKRGAK